MYHFIKARALNKAGEYSEAIKVLKMLVSLPQMKGEIKKGPGSCITTSEQVSIYLELAEALRLNGELVRNSGYNSTSIEKSYDSYFKRPFMTREISYKINW